MLEVRVQYVEEQVLRDVDAIDGVVEVRTTAAPTVVIPPPWLAGPDGVTAAGPSPPWLPPPGFQEPGAEALPRGEFGGVFLALAFGVI